LQDKEDYDRKLLRHLR